jgi:hypothetical protein
MLSTKLVKLIESNWEEIAGRVILAVKKHPDLPNLAALPDLELREWCQEILQNIGYVLSKKKDEDIQRRFRLMGRLRFEEKIPLHEAVLRVHLLKDKVIGFIHEQGFAMSAMQLYAEEELEHRLSRLFDACVYYLVRGYEDALRLETRVATRPAPRSLASRL